MAEKGEGWALPFISCAQDTVGLQPLTLTAPTAIRLWETFTFFLLLLNLTITVLSGKRTVLGLKVLLPGM